MKHQHTASLAWWKEDLDFGASVILHRLTQFYWFFVLLGALLCGFAIATQGFVDPYPQTTAGQASEGLLCSSTLTSLVCVIITTMLLFHHEDTKEVKRIDLALAWTPVILLDISLIELLIGITCWYWGKNKHWQGTILALELFGLLSWCVGISAWIWCRTSQNMPKTDNVGMVTPPKKD